MSNQLKKRALLVSGLLGALVLTVVGGNVASARGFGGFGFFTKEIAPEEMAKHQVEMFTHEAELLGVSIDIVKDGWADGKSLLEIAEEQGVSEEALKERMRAKHEEQMKAHIQALVDQGVISQEQADRRLQVMQNYANEGGRIMLRRGFGEGMKLHGGF
jgi:hypothetical protein